MLYQIAIDLITNWCVIVLTKLRRDWEEEYGYEFPKEPYTDKPMTPHHIRALADGGINDGSNIMPVTAPVHTETDTQAGDFKRWGGQRNRESQ